MRVRVLPSRRSAPSRWRSYASARRVSERPSGRRTGGMYDPGLNRHEWESEFASLEDGLHDDPAGALPELDGLVARMLEEAGYDLEDPIAREGEEREVISEYAAAHEITRASEAGNDEISSGDVAS